MITQQLQVSILAAPVAAIDPRALSQAWYSALRLARAGKRERCLAFARRDPSIHHSFRGALDSSEGKPGVPTGFASSVRQASRGATTVAGDAPSARSGVRKSLARRIERAFADSRAPQRRATFSLGHGTARVHVILQTSGNKSALVALCRPDLQPVVARALAAAGRALAARGVGGELQLRTVGRCF